MVKIAQIDKGQGLWRPLCNRTPKASVIRPDAALQEGLGRERNHDKGQAKVYGGPARPANRLEHEPVGRMAEEQTKSETGQIHEAIRDRIRIHRCVKSQEKEYGEEKIAARKKP